MVSRDTCGACIARDTNPERRVGRTMEKIMKATMKLLAELPLSGEGKEECPVCGGTVSWKRVPSKGVRKGYVFMRCSTDGCVKMQGH